MSNLQGQYYWKPAKIKVIHLLADGHSVTVRRDTKNYAEGIKAKTTTIKPLNLELLLSITLVIQLLVISILVASTQ